jgi:glycosyltransferase involved in cell wall biosynthesis
MRKAMLRWPAELIFLSEAERREWTSGARGRVVPNFVDFRRFDRSLDRNKVRRELGLRKESLVVLYVGGTSRVKGIFPLLRALALVKEVEPKLVCLMPGSVHKPSDRWLSKTARLVLSCMGSGTHAQLVDRKIKQLGLEETCVRSSFTSHMERFLAACDVLVFPAITNHFARPVIEAGAMARPVIVSRFPILEELVKHEETGLIVPCGEPEALADAILTLLRNPQQGIECGERAYAIAKKRYDANANTQAIMEVYGHVLGVHRTLTDAPGRTGSLVGRSPA